MPDALDPDRFAPAADGGINRAAADGFERGAGDYEQSRPSYPAAAVELVVDELAIGPGRRVLDLAAGTGKFTRLLEPTGAELVAVEPVAAMRAQLQAALPAVSALDGTAEQIPLSDASVDVVVVAQAFHWFDAPLALAEVGRVLRVGDQPPSGLALIWNQQDEEVGWVRRFGEILVDAAGSKPYVSGTDWPAVVAAAGGFEPLQHRTFDFEAPMTPDLLVTRAASTSFVSALPDDARRACLARVRELAATDPDLVGLDRFGFPYVTHVYWCHRI